MTRIAVTPWGFSLKGPADAFGESVFAQGNGQMGARGFACDEEKQAPSDHGVYWAGLFEYVKPGITDMIQLPDPFYTRLSFELPPLTLQDMDMQKGLLTHLREGNGLRITCLRFLSMAQPGISALRYSITAFEDRTILLETGIDGKVANLPVADNQLIKNRETVRLLHPVACKEGYLHMESAPSGHSVVQFYGLSINLPVMREDVSTADQAVTRITANLKTGQTLTVDKIIYTRTSRDAAGLASATMPEAGFDKLFEEHVKAWAERWHDCDMELEASPEMQGAARYSIYQLLQNCLEGDERVSIGARGILHGRYKGNTFWDTEIFMLPFYQYTRPLAAKGLLSYRLHLLPDALESARSFNLKGARYPWMCSDTGREQCESWDTGACEIHITADVAYALIRYMKATGDESIRKAYAELLAQTARYWMSRMTYEPDLDRYSLLFVKGPDEYCGVTVNNTYTNYMVRHNLALAAREGSAAEEERRIFAEAAEKLVLLYDEKRGLYLQDELFERLEPMPEKKNKDASLYKELSYDRLQRYKALKQADLVLLMTLFPADFTEKQKRNIWNYYEPLTLHDSTLSFGVHAQLALQLNDFEKADTYLYKSLFLDLYDIMENTGEEGVHMAAFGAAWQALAFGAAGVIFDENGTVTAQPHLPKSIRAMRFTVSYQGKQYRISVSASGKAEVQLITQ
jgi:trehalose/maltose hydrolase-like predicted phosphorylase